ncbi:MAG: 4Fe-4S binding protein [Granulosicoccus sp.]|nr:4Fe-4S binding protein [Granulosicoccus sp.]
MNEQQHPVGLVRDTSELEHRQQLGEATSQIRYVSQGHCLVIGALDQALEAGARLSGNTYTVVSIDANASHPHRQLTEDGVAVFTVPRLALSGHLGAYRALVPANSGDPDSALDIGVSVYRESGLFDVVLDLSESPVLSMRLPPFGYVHATSEQAIVDAIQTLGDLQGEFEKPRYFNYSAGLCAHSRSALDGCSRCIESCATGAITPSGDGISVDPFLCQGCGSCATVCPSGAMTYAYPRPADAIERTRRLLKEQGRRTILLHTEGTESAVQQAIFPDEVLPLLVEEVSAFGPDYWLAMLAASAPSVVVVLDAPEDDPNRQALEAQLHWLRPLLAALGIRDFPVQLVSSAELGAWLDGQRAQQASTPSPLDTLTPGYFSTHNDKRQTIRLALDTLWEHAGSASSAVALPEGAPFGQIKVDTQACTLCMACVSTCPASALQDGQESPALRFVESNCLQCGLCEAACPESAITLEARYTWDSVAARRVETLHEEQPFHCLRCHTAFTTQAMIDNMSEKLAGHWMFQDEKARRRLRLCGDCRVRDMFEEDAGGIEVHQDRG